MPIYEFHCADCRRDSEVLVRSTRWEGTPCPHCGSTQLEKKLSVFASNVADSNSCEAPACGMGNGRGGGGGGCGACCGGGPHRH
ncbi:MAG: FmdB family zinc ribbon protein [Limisphaerales bacterium]